jgi:AraC-like DNA-binding protein
VIEVSARIGAFIVHTAGAAGADAAALCAATGFDPARAEDPDARIPLALETALWDEASRRTGDDAFGLHAAERLSTGAFGVLDYLLRTAPTVRALLDRLARYNRLAHDVAVVSVIERGDVTRVEHALRGSGLTQSRHAAEFTLAAVVVGGGQMSGAPLRPRAVCFRHPAPSATAEHARVFGAEPRFAMEVNALELDAAAVARPCPGADPVLSQVMERYAEALLAARPDPGEGTAGRVRSLLMTELGAGVASLAGVAARLRMSERSLQRRLADEGVTFDGLLDDLRRELALRYLGDRKLAIAEVAYMLGYSEPSPFHRAVKRWTGATPSEVRRRAAGEPLRSPERSARA